MTALKLLVAVALVTCLSLAFRAAPATVQAETTAIPRASGTLSQVAGGEAGRAVLKTINAIRADHDAAPLAMNPALVAAAREISAIMARRDDLELPESVNFGDVIERHGYYYQAAFHTGLAYTRAEPDERDTWERREILDRLTDDAYTDAGIAETVSELTGRHYMSVILAGPPIITAPGVTLDQAGEATQDSQAAIIARLLNAAREDEGLATLAINDHLMAAALAHSEDMAARDEMTHEGSDGSRVGGRATEAGYVWRMVGENVLRRENLHGGLAFDQWWTSPEHHETMMHPEAREIGVGYAVSDSGVYYYTMVIGRAE